ncbi:MAG: non-homologous end-joining DNA ligase [Actinomycetota bacterium]
MGVPRGRAPFGRSPDRSGREGEAGSPDKIGTTVGRGKAKLFPLQVYFDSNFLDIQILKMKSWMKRSIKPMLAQLARPFDSSNHIFELKWDGVRCIAFLSAPNRDGTRLQNRNLRDITRSYPELNDLHLNLRGGEAILDGEIVFLREGKPDFQKLLEREQLQDDVRIDILSKIIPVTYIAFDILYFDGSPLFKLPLIERRKILIEAIKESKKLILSRFVWERGIDFFEQASGQGFEGIVAKESNSPYIEGKRTNFWLKIKRILTQDCVICGYTLGRGCREEVFGSLILGLYHKGELIHVGQVGTGLTEEKLKGLLPQLEALKINEHPFSCEPEIDRPAQFIRPSLVCEVEFRGWTKDGKLRNPGFKRLRPDKPAGECRKSRRI